MVRVKHHWADPNGHCKSDRSITRFLNVVFDGSLNIHVKGPFHKIMGISGDRIH